MKLKIRIFANMGTLIVHPDTQEKLKALKAVMKALNIAFEEEKSSYDPKFVKKIEESRKQIEEGKYTRVERKDLSKFLGLE